MHSEPYIYDLVLFATKFLASVILCAWVLQPNSSAHIRLIEIKTKKIQDFGPQNFNSFPKKIVHWQLVPRIPKLPLK